MRANSASPLFRSWAGHPLPSAADPRNMEPNDDDGLEGMSLFIFSSFSPIRVFLARVSSWALEAGMCIKLAMDIYMKHGSLERLV